MRRDGEHILHEESVGHGYKGKGREDSRKHDGETRAKDTSKVGPILD